MNSLNSILLEGNLVRDPEASKTSKGISVCKFTIASNRFYKVDDEFQEEVSYFDIKVWAKMADTCNRKLTKGSGVRIIGRLKQDRWKDKEGNDKSAVYVIADHVEFKPSFKKTV